MPPSFCQYLENLKFYSKFYRRKRITLLPTSKVSKFQLSISLRLVDMRRTYMKNIAIVCFIQSPFSTETMSYIVQGLNESSRPCIDLGLSRANELIKHANIVILNEEAGLRGQESRFPWKAVPVESRWRERGRNEIAEITFVLG